MFSFPIALEWFNSSFAIWSLACKFHAVIVKLSNDTKIDATVSGTEKSKYNMDINEFEYVIVKVYYIVALMSRMITTQQ